MDSTYGYGVRSDLPPTKLVLLRPISYPTAYDHSGVVIRPFRILILVSPVLFPHHFLVPTSKPILCGIFVLLLSRDRFYTCVSRHNGSPTNRRQKLFRLCQGWNTRLSNFLRYNNLGYLHYNGLSLLSPTQAASFQPYYCWTHRHSPFSPSPRSSQLAGRWNPCSS